MKSIMKTILRNTKLVMILAFLPALLSAAQVQAVDYKGTYKGSRIQPTIGVATTATAPTVGFQSTSAYSAQWQEEQEEPMLNADGTVNEGAYVGASPHVRKNGPGGGPGSSPGTPGGDLNKDDQQPLGDGLMALMLCACAYLIVRATRKEEKIG